jgi:hypothetical protein
MKIATNVDVRVGHPTPFGFTLIANREPRNIASLSPNFHGEIIEGAVPPIKPRVVPERQLPLGTL